MVLNSTFVLLWLFELINGCFISPSRLCGPASLYNTILSQSTPVSRDFRPFSQCFLCLVIPSCVRAPLSDLTLRLYLSAFSVWLYPPFSVHPCLIYSSSKSPNILLWPLVSVHHCLVLTSYRKALCLVIPPLSHWTSVLLTKLGTRFF